MTREEATKLARTFRGIQFSWQEDGLEGYVRKPEHRVKDIPAAELRRLLDEVDREWRERTGR
jgi:hypothetical protein